MFSGDKRFLHNLAKSQAFYLIDTDYYVGNPEFVGNHKLRGDLPAFIFNFDQYVAHLTKLKQDELEDNLNA